MGLAYLPTTSTTCVSQGAVVGGDLSFTNDAYLRPALDLLPSGPVWPKTSGLIGYAIVRAGAHTFSRIDARARRLVEREALPSKTSELLPEWEAAFGITPSGTDDDRRTNLVGKLAGRGPTPAARPVLLSLVNALGYATPTIRTYASFNAGHGAGGLDYDQRWRFRADYVVYTRGISTDLLLKSTLADRAQGHTVIGVLVAWSKWTRKLLDTTTAWTVTGGFPVKPIGTAPGGVVLVGSNGNVWFTTHGRIWKQIPVTVGYTGQLENGAQNNAGTVILTGTSEVFYRCIGDATFTRVPLGGAGALKAAGTDGTNFVIGGAGGSLYSSPDGVIWTNRVPASGFTYGTFSDAVWNPVRSLWFVGSNGGELQSSPDGFTWTRVIAGSSDLGIFSTTLLASGEVLIGGSNGNAYTRVSLTGAITYESIAAFTYLVNIRVSSDGGCLIAVGTASGIAKMAISYDNGATWVTKDLATSDTALAKLVMGPSTQPIAIAATGLSSGAVFVGSYNGLENAI